MGGKHVNKRNTVSSLLSHFKNSDFPYSVVSNYSNFRFNNYCFNFKLKIFQHHLNANLLVVKCKKIQCVYNSVDIYKLLRRNGVSR